MSSIAAELADALKTDVDDQTWPVTLTSYREYLYPLERTQMGAENRLSVFPFEQASAREGRGGTSDERGIGVVLRAGVAASDTAAVDALIETHEQLVARYLLTNLTYDTDKIAVPRRVEMINGDQVYDVDRLGQAHVFQGGFIITYQTRT